MLNPEAIRKIIGPLLIPLFALCITPKIILHNLVADHKDVSTGFKNNKQNELTGTRFNCHIENIVAESPFINTSVRIECLALPNFILKNDLFRNNLLSYYQYYSTLRGPPAI